MLKRCCCLTAIILSLVVYGFSQNITLPAFEDYKVPVYSGKIKPPKWIRWVRGGEWRDNLGKLVDSPDVNFAGKYFAVVHSCGTGCRYYTLTDLTTGREVKALAGFGSGEEPPKTKEGYDYYEKLFFWPNSRLLIAQYEVEAPQGTECRERSFVLETDRLKPVTPTIYSCRNLE